MFVIRHGEKENDNFDSNITGLGKNQARNISKLFKDSGIKRIYTSANPRSIQTGKIISEEINIPIEIIDSISELQKEVFFQKESEWKDDCRKIIENVREFLAQIKEKDEDVMLTMNAGINRVILSIILDIPLHKTIHFTQEVACLNLFEFKEIYGEKRWCVGLLNSTYHLK